LSGRGNAADNGAERLKQLNHGVSRNLEPVMSITVAVVDDDPSMLKGVERLLKAHGFGTEVYASAEAFLDRPDQSNVNCLVLDINLGGMSGIELSRLLRASGSVLPIVFLTGVDDEARRATALSAGGTAYLNKPFPGNLLIEAIRKAAV
jgi:FixJ family two-component response regulator